MRQVTDENNAANILFFAQKSKYLVGKALNETPNRPNCKKIGTQGRYLGFFCYLCAAKNVER
jgi:hypothetical protein